MTKIACSKAAPWGIHQTLRDLECPRCGWAADVPQEPSSAEAEPPALKLLLGGWSPAAAAA